MSELTGKKYRLPTEAEWEYAARGGRNADGTKYAGSNSIEDVAWYDGNLDPSSVVNPVGMKNPNGLGLYDMSGNTSEWCLDWYGDYSSLPEVNPHGPSSGSYYVVRGMRAQNNLAYACRVSSRGTCSNRRLDGTGFRIVCEP